LNTTPPVQTGQVRTVASDGHDLQAQINAAQPGDTIEIPPGTLCTGNYSLPAKGGNGWIVIRTAGPDPVPPGTRMTPGKPLARILSPNTSPAVATMPSAHNYRRPEQRSHGRHRFVDR
jgi:hypothetical protein